MPQTDSPAPGTRFRVADRSETLIALEVLDYRPPVQSDAIFEDKHAYTSGHLVRSVGGSRWCLTLSGDGWFGRAAQDETG